MICDAMVTRSITFDFLPALTAIAEVIGVIFNTALRAFVDECANPQSFPLQGGTTVTALFMIMVVFVLLNLS